MHLFCFRVFATLATILGSMAIANAASLDLLPPKSRGNRIALAPHGDPCLTPGSKSATPSEAPWRAGLSRSHAVYVIQHIQKACRILTDRRDKENAARLDAILDGLRISVLGPIYRAHPDLRESLPPEPLAAKETRGTPRDVQRTTAIRLTDELSRLQRRISGLAGKGLDTYADKSAAEQALRPFLDAFAELSFAGKTAYDAYPDLFAKKFGEIPLEARTEESDANFRKRAPPRGSVRLSEKALALVTTFMKQVQQVAPRADQIASIGWVRDQKKKGPDDAGWIDGGPGWVLGAYARTQVPPDVIDRVGGIDIVFSAEDPSTLAGKVVDADNRKFFVRD